MSLDRDRMTVDLWRQQDPEGWAMLNGMRLRVKNAIKIMEIWLEQEAEQE